MRYKMIVEIADPNVEMGYVSGLHFDLVSTFYQDENGYGNGHWVTICGSGAISHFENTYDLRYDKTFNRGKKEEWLRNWAKSYWSGKDGAWAVVALTIEKL